MRINTSKLTSTQLDWAVAKCENKLPISYNDWRQVRPKHSTNRMVAYLIIDREMIAVKPAENEGWEAYVGPTTRSCGATHHSLQRCEPMDTQAWGVVRKFPASPSKLN